MVSIVRSAAWIVAAIGLGLIGACIPPLAEEMPCPQCLAKSDFAGDWTYRIESLSSEDEKSGSCLAERTTGTVRFEIHETWLLAWLLPEPLSAEGCLAYRYSDCAQVVGVWKVRHFDYQARCSERTGEQLNIITDNLHDHCEPYWYERRYIRVDWSRNLALTTEVERLTDGAAEVEPVPHDATSPNDELFPEVDLGAETVGAVTGSKRLSVSSVGLARLSTCSDSGEPTMGLQCFSIDLGPVSCDLREVRLRQIFSQPTDVQ